jgi:hypothetical protein
MRKLDSGKRQTRMNRVMASQSSPTVVTSDVACHVDAYHAQLKDRGVDIDAEVSRFGDAVPPLFWFRDPEGNTLMVVEAP